MAWYRAGTATFTNGSTAVAGSGTAWATNVRPGDEIIGPDNISREVETVTSDTALTMVETYAGSTAAGAAYKVKPIQGWNRDVAAQLAALINDYGSIEAALTVLSGNVGIGTAGPASKLHVAGDVRVDGRVIQQRAAGSAYLVTMGFSDTLGGSKTDNLSIGNDGSGALLLHTNSAERLRIDSLGNVGLGVSPTAKLHIASGTNKWMRLESSAVSASFMQLDAGAGSGVLGYIGSNGGGALSGGAGADLVVRAEQSLLLASGGNVERMRISSSGNVLVSRPAIGNSLIIGSLIGQYPIYVSDSVCESYWYSGGASGIAIGTITSHPMSFYTGNTMRGQFKASGQFHLAPMAADPDGVAGDMCFNGATGKFRGHTGSGWVDLH